MKKIVVILVLMFVFLFIPSIEAQHHVGIIGGLNFAEVNIDPLGDDSEVGPRTAFSFGSVININITPVIGLQFEPSYMQKGSSFNISLYEEGVTIIAEETIKADYIDVPVLLRATFNVGNVKPYLIAGLAPAFLVNDVKEVLDKLVVDGVDYTSYIPENEREIELKSNSFDLGVNFGAGLSIPLGNVILFLEGQYSLGLLNLNDEEPTPGFEVTKIRNRGFQIKTGVSFPLTLDKSEEHSPGEAN